MLAHVKFKILLILETFQTLVDDCVVSSVYSEFRKDISRTCLATLLFGNKFQYSRLKRVKESDSTWTVKPDYSRKYLAA